MSEIEKAWVTLELGDDHQVHEVKPSIPLLCIKGQTDKGYCPCSLQQGHAGPCEDTTPPPAPAPVAALPTDAKTRKAIPIVAGCLDYFPAALVAVAELSRVGNEQHTPGQPLHHARGKSNDHADCILRHLMDRGTIDTDGIRHSAKVAWRALALLQVELEAAGAPLARGARVAEPSAIEQAMIDGPALYAAQSKATVCKSCGGTIPGFCQDC